MTCHFIFNVTFINICQTQSQIPQSPYRKTVVTPVSAPRDERHDVTGVQYRASNKKSKHLCPSNVEAEDGTGFRLYFKRAVVTWRLLPACYYNLGENLLPTLMCVQTFLQIIIYLNILLTALHRTSSLSVKYADMFLGVLLTPEKYGRNLNKFCKVLV